MASSALPARPGGREAERSAGDGGRDRCAAVPLAPALRVQFSKPGEFIAELRRRPPDIEPVVRLTYRWSADGGGLPLCHLSVIAGYLRRPHGMLVVQELVYHTGEVWQGLHEEAGQRTLERAHRAYDAVARVARELGLEIGAGVYELDAGYRRVEVPAHASGAGAGRDAG